MNMQAPASRPSNLQAAGAGSLAASTQARADHQKIMNSPNNISCCSSRSYRAGAAEMRSEVVWSWCWWCFASRWLFWNRILCVC